ncbi:putative 3-hydroxyphenylpropionic transporter MhpT [compost metagenome]
MVSIFLSGAAFIGGQGAIVVLIANSYPASIRSISVGWALTVGRIGAIMSPAVVSIPLGWGWQAGQILLLPILPAVIGALAVFLARPSSRTRIMPAASADVET